VARTTLTNLKQRVHEQLLLCIEKQMCGRLAVYHYIAQRLGCSWHTVKRYGERDRLIRFIPIRIGHYSKYPAEMIIDHMRSGKFKTQRELANYLGCREKRISHVCVERRINNMGQL